MLMTRYIAAYDTESPACLVACRKIVEAHRRHDMPATFFIVGKTLEESRQEYVALLDDPLFEIASHTYSHKMLRDHPICGPAASPEQREIEIRRGKEVVEDAFGRECVGVRPGCGFSNAMRGATEELQHMASAGFGYVSSQLWGADYSLPAPIDPPSTYAADGFPDLWELPGHGWHENILKNATKVASRRMTLWPPERPAAIPDAYVETPQEEFAVNRVFLNAAADEGAPFASLIWHPWSLHRFDPDMAMLDLTFQYVRSQGLQPCTYDDLYRRVSEGAETEGWSGKPDDM
jgi:peptidoglycan/xylan/chitin deacetylase (PgdA/CDA1 family)